jgi:hypothetical protein
MVEKKVRSKGYGPGEKMGSDLAGLLGPRRRETSKGEERARPGDREAQERGLGVFLFCFYFLNI